MDKLIFSGINLTFPMLSFEKSLQLLRLMDFTRADISLTGDQDSRHLNISEELNAPQENGRRLLEMMQRTGLKQTDLFVIIGDHREAALNHPDKQVRDFSFAVFTNAVTYAKACQCDHMTIVPGVEFDDDHQASLKRASDELKKRVDHAAQRGITLAIETHIESIADTPAKAKELLKMTDGLTLTLDYSHFICNGADQDEIDELIPYASHMHLRNAAKGSSQTIFSESQIDYRRVIYLLRKQQYQGGLTMEFCSHSGWDQNRVDTVGETIRLREHLQDIWEEYCDG